MIVDGDNYRLKKLCLTNAFKNDQQREKIFLYSRKFDFDLIN